MQGGDLGRPPVRARGPGTTATATPCSSLVDQDGDGACHTGELVAASTAPSASGPGLPARPGVSPAAAGDRRADAGLAPPTLRPLARDTASCRCGAELVADT